MPAPRDSLRVLTISRLAEVSGLAASTVSATLNRAGIAPAAVEGRRKLFDAPQALRLLLAGDKLDGKRESARLDAARANLAELELRKRRGELVPVADVDHGYIALASAVSARMLALPSSLSLELATESNPSKCGQLLATAIREVLSDLAAEGRRAAARIDAREAADAARAHAREGGES